VVTGDVIGGGTVSLGPYTNVKGAVKQNHEPDRLPDIDLSTYDPDGWSGVETFSQSDVPATDGPTEPITLEGVWRRSGDLSFEGNLKLDGGYLYVDGSQVATASGAVQALVATLPTVIGRDDRDLNSYFNGSICDVAIYTSALSAGRVGVHASTGVLANSPMKLNLVAGGWVEDSKPSGTPHDGQNLGTTWVASNTDGASVTRSGVAQFASGAQVAIPADPDFNSPTGTICFWMQTGNPPAGTGMMLVDRRTSAGLVMVLDGTPSGGINVQYTGNTSFSGGGYVVDGNWHHVALVYDQSASGSVLVYVDGNLTGSQANTAAWSWPTGQQIELGRSHDTYWQEYNGLMDDFRIYGRALSQTELATLATPATSDTLIDTSTLMARYNFGTAAGVGTGLAWPQIGVLQSSPTLDASAVWTPIDTTTPSYPFLPPYSVTNSVMFYRLKL
jgi:hypothetical protein